MGEVYRATDSKLDRLVAVKVLPPGMAENPERLERFRREAKALAALDHPGIVTVYSVEEAEGVHFLTMQLVDGRPLDRLIPPGGMAHERVLAIGNALAEAIAAAHERGIVHRDLKPANVMVTADDRVKVLDFGLARVLEPAGGSDVTIAASLTSDGAVMGTLPYMSPEQVSGRPVDPRTDVFALGVMLYEMATGRRPFRGDTPAELSAAILRDAPPALGDAPGSVQAELDRVVRRALAKDPVARFPSARELHAELSRLGAGGPREESASIVVVPLVNRSPDPNNEYFSDGLSEELIADLGKIRALRVISYNSAMQLKGTDKDTRTIGRELGVRHVLTGGVRKEGANVRITVSLADAKDDRVVWTGKYGGALDDIFEMQEQVSRAIVTALRLSLSLEEDHSLRARRVSDARAFDLYLRARQDIFSTSKERAERAIRLLEDGLKIEQESPLLLAMLGYARVVYLKSRWPEDEDHERREIARCMDRLLACAPDSPLADFLQGMIAYERGDLRVAIPHLSRSVTRDPNNPEVLVWLLVSLLYVGRDAQSVGPLMDHLLAIDPLTPLGLSMKAAFVAFDGSPADAIPILERADAIDPTSADTLWSYAYGLALGGRLDDASEVFDRLVQFAPEMVYTNQMAALLAGCRGDAAEARTHLTADLRNAAAHDQHLSLHVAECWAVIGDQDEALACLRVAIRHGFVHHPFFSRHNPFLARLQAAPEFAELMEQARLEWQYFASVPLPSIG